MIGDEALAQEVVIEEFESLGIVSDVWGSSMDKLSDHPGHFKTSLYEEDGYKGRPNVAVIKSGTGDGRSLGFSGHIDSSI